MSVYATVIGATKTKPPLAYPLTLDTLANCTRSGRSIAGVNSIIPAIKALRDEKDEAARKLIKQKDLPAFIPAGIFTGNANDSLVKHSGLLVLDWDESELKEASVDAAQLFSTLTDKPWCVMAFISPSGRGVKGLVYLSPIPENADAHRQAFEQINGRTGKLGLPALDTTGKDAKRFCYQSYDPNVYYNPVAEALEWQWVKPLPNDAAPTEGPEGDELAVIAAQILTEIPREPFTQGGYEEWYKIIRAARNCGVSRHVVEQWSTGAKNHDDRFDNAWTSTAENKRLGRTTLVNARKRYLAEVHGEWPRPLGDAKGDYNHFAQAERLVEDLPPDTSLMVVRRREEGSSTYRVFVQWGGIWHDDQSELRRQLGLAAIRWLGYALPPSSEKENRKKAYSALAGARDTALAQDKVIARIPEVFTKHGHRIYEEHELNLPGAIATSSGVVDLASQKLLPNNKAAHYRITVPPASIKYNPEPYKPENDPARVKALTAHLDPEDAELFWAFMGQALHRQPIRGALFLYSDEPNTGKSTALRALSSITGQTAPFDAKALMTEHEYSYIPNQCNLHSAAIVYADEVHNLELHTDRFKEWTGGEANQFSCNPKMRAAHTGQQTASFVMVGNGMPQMDYEEAATRNRLWLVEFPVPDIGTMDQASICKGDSPRATREREALLRKLVYYASEYTPGTPLPMPVALPARRQGLATSGRTALEQFLALRMVKGTANDRVYVDEIWAALLGMTMGDFLDKFPKGNRKGLEWEDETNTSLGKNISKFLKVKARPQAHIVVTEEGMKQRFQVQSRYWEGFKLLSTDELPPEPPPSKDAGDLFDEEPAAPNGRQLADGHHNEHEAPPASEEPRNPTIEDIVGY